jgi:hypothetical protein
MFFVYVDCRYVVFINLFELLLTHFLWKACAGEVAVHLSYKMVFLLKKKKKKKKVCLCDYEIGEVTPQRSTKLYIRGEKCT